VEEAACIHCHGSELYEYYNSWTVRMSAPIAMHEVI